MGEAVRVRMVEIAAGAADGRAADVVDAVDAAVAMAVADMAGTEAAGGDTSHGFSRTRKGRGFGGGGLFSLECNPKIRPAA